MIIFIFLQNDLPQIKNLKVQCADFIMSLHLNDTNEADFRVQSKRCFA